ncbi:MULTISPECIES: type II toxin-antitoxin system VapC family toxin [Sphingosinicellaceae]|uniref:type II toxin-antitoxin system VapC family toxin n=1 Tax=Sphingosinicellaceae TaxID=2820280 RepID=UPI001C1E4D33|nr:MULTISPECIES: type II toxin-antitoxin system VapC family toxin [Polymorphobacter]QYE33470.1 type II toxin-antitoxin system VapC family toxin [Polymorphobacter sp. PAMC 29334]UAJ12834.1 type II toxin-antitoxin system VapC family toxin [Polymorphobacter megasporae]
MASIVFDASAILALLRDEPGADVVAQYIGDGLISAVNFQEVIKGLLRREVPNDAALAMLDALHLDVRPHGRDDAVAAANLYPATKAFGSGLGDRTCTALAIAEGLPVLTADREWARIEIPGLKLMLAR